MKLFASISLTLILLFYAINLCAENYAVLITGDTPAGESESPKNWNEGECGEMGFDEFWNDTYMMWEMLYEFGFTDDHIYVLYGDGNDDETWDRIN